MAQIIRGILSVFENGILPQANLALHDARKLLSQSFYRIIQEKKTLTISEGLLENYIFSGKSDNLYTAYRTITTFASPSKPIRDAALLKVDECRRLTGKLFNAKFQPVNN